MPPYIFLDFVVFFVKCGKIADLASPSTENPRYLHCPEVTDITNMDNIRSTDRS